MEKAYDYRNTIWVSKDGPISVKNMSTVHINKVVRSIENGQNHYLSEQSSLILVIALRSELRRREKIADSVLNKFPLLNDKLQDAIEQKLRNRLFSTKDLNFTDATIKC